MGISLPYRASLRHLLRQPWQLGLGVLGIALGVAAVVAIQTTRASVTQAFDAATQAIIGGATHQIVAGPGGVEEPVYAQLRRAAIGARITPVINRGALLPDHGFRPVTVIGIDPFAERGLGGRLGGSMPVTIAFLTRPGAIANARTAATLGLSPGARFAINGDGHAARLELLAIATGPIPDDTLIVDLATAQELFAFSGRLSSIDLILDADPVTAQHIHALLPPGHWLVPAGSERASLSRLTDAFHANLGALSLLALLVGMFLVYNAQSFLVLQRRELFGRLRTLGVTRWQLARIVLFEAALFGVAGTAAGMALGIVLARRLLQLTLRTINDLYFNLSVADIHLSAPLAIGAALLGIGGTVLATVPAIIAAARANPRQLSTRIVGERHAAQTTRRAAWLGLALIAVGVATLALPGAGSRLGLGSLFLLIFGCALLVPRLVSDTLGIVQRPLGAMFGLSGFQAARSARRNLSRTGVAVAALALAIASGIGIGTMVESFRRSVDAWLEHMLRADLYVSVIGADDNATAGALTDPLLQDILRIDGVTAFTTTRSLTLTLPEDLVHLTGYQLNPRAYSGFQLLAGDRDAIWRRWERESVAIASEPFARHRHLALGDRITLPTRDGEVTFELAGIYRDYSSDNGTLALSRATLERQFGEVAAAGAGIYLAPGADAVAVQRAIEALLPADGLLRVRPNRVIRELSMQVFERTFAITSVLRDVATMIAAIGVFAGLLALALERTREFATQRALGLTRAGLWRQLMLETALLGLLAGLCALPIGLLIALVLIDVVNVRAFGWTMQVHIPWPALGHGLLLALVAALLAGCYPAWRLSTQPPAVALREE